jgi:hypothetical protein
MNDVNRRKKGNNKSFDELFSNVNFNALLYIQLSSLCINSKEKLGIIGNCTSQVVILRPTDVCVFTEFYVLSITHLQLRLLLVILHHSQMLQSNDNFKFKRQN